MAQSGNLAQASDWQQLFHDPALNVEAFQAQYRIQRADLFPAVSATGAGKRQKLPGTGSGNAAITSSYSATLGISAYELDLFGRVRSLSEQAMLTYLSTEEARRSAQLRFFHR